jgi:predicted TIM-barrel fold metal-dependent hydrolase
MLCWGNVDAGTALIDRHPDARFIIDHLAIMQPRTPPAPPQPWADLPKVLDLAKRKNAVIKVSGACTLSREPYPFPDIWDPLARVFDAWGLDSASGAPTGPVPSRLSTTNRPSSPSVGPTA